MSDQRICNPIISIGPDIGSGTQTDNRICKTVIGVGPDIGIAGPIIIYGEAGAVVHGAAGKIRYR